MDDTLNLDKAIALYREYALDLSDRTWRNQRDRVALWRRMGCTDDCRQITTETFQEFRRAALARGLRPYTIETAVNAIKTLLRHLGPRQDGVPHGLGLIPAVPYTGRRLKIVLQPRPPATLEQLSEIYDHADYMTYPAAAELPASTWWRVFLVLAYNTGLRISDLVYRLAWQHVRRDQRVIELSAGKTGLLHRLPINATLARHLDLLPHRVGLLLPLSTRQTTVLLVHLRAACEDCGVEYFTPHAIRRAAGAAFEIAHPGAGALLLGHSLQRGMTFGHYIAAEAVLRPAADKIPQPAAFLNSGGN